MYYDRFAQCLFDNQLSVSSKVYDDYYCIKLWEFSSIYVVNCSMYDAAGSLWRAEVGESSTILCCCIRYTLSQYQCRNNNRYVHCLCILCRSLLMEQAGHLG